MTSSTIKTPELGTVHHLDCVEGMRALPPGSIDLVFADPPFNIGYDYDVYRDEKEDHEYLSWSRSWMAAVHHVLKPDGTFWLAIGDEYAAELKVEARRLGFQLRSWVIWYYTFGVNCKFKFSRSHAHLFYFVKDPQKFTFLHDAMENRIPSARRLVYGDRRANPSGRLPDDTWILRPQDLSDCFTPDEDTWYFPRVAGTFKERAGFHGCQMPEQLLGRIIRFCSRAGEIVLDPFSGSATTLAVAKKLRRQFVGFDLSEDYVRRGRVRLAGIRVGDRLDGSTEPTISAPASRPPSRKSDRSGKSLFDELLDASEEFWDAKSRDDYDAGLVDAFAKAHDGYSIDRIVVDPELNSRFRDACVANGLPGDISAWNMELFRLRKSGAMSGFRTLHPTTLTWEACDVFLFASEIAWKLLIDKGHPGLDRILCWPDVAAEFDRHASQFAPGYSSLEYRWGALKIRKQALRTRNRARRLNRPDLVAFHRDATGIDRDSLDRFPDGPGIYMVSDRATNQAIYVGETLGLKSRMRAHFHAERKEAWADWGEALEVRFFTLDSPSPELQGYQCLCVRQHTPRLNLPATATIDRSLREATTA